MRKNHLPLGADHPLVAAIADRNAILARRLADCNPGRFGKPCRQIACPHCRVLAVKKMRRRTSLAFQGAQNADCSSVTINLALCGSMEDVGSVVATFRSALRNLRDRQGRLEGRWKAVVIRGVVEVDLIAVDDVRHVYGQRRGVLVELRRHGVAGREMAMVPHVHLVINHAGIDRDAVRTVIEGQWPGPHRTKTVPFRTGSTAASNAGGVVAYSTKHNAKVKIESDRMAWPVEMQADYWSWLYSIGRGLATLAIGLGGRRMRRKKVTADDQAWAGEMTLLATRDTLIIGDRRARAPHKKRDRDSSPSSASATAEEPSPTPPLGDCISRCGVGKINSDNDGRKIDYRAYPITDARRVSSLAPEHLRFVSQTEMLGHMRTFAAMPLAG